MTKRNYRKYAEIGHRIASRRRELGNQRGTKIRQADVAEAVGVDLNTVTAWETGKQRPEGQNLVKLATFLKVEPHQITGDVNISTEKSTIPAGPTVKEKAAGYDAIVLIVRATSGASAEKETGGEDYRRRLAEVYEEFARALRGLEETTPTDRDAKP